LLNACEPDFRIIVRAALETGARHQELARLRVADFNPDSGTLHIRKSKASKDRHVILSEDGAALFAGSAAGRRGSDLLLGREWRPGLQARRMAVACERARIDPPITFHGLRHTWASQAVMGGMPLAVVAASLGHADTRMVERTYAHLSAGYVVEQVRKYAPRFGPVGKNNVTPMK
jgi:integrase